MNRTLLPALLLLFLNCCNAQQFQLAPPMLHYSSAFFSNSATVLLKFEQAGTQIFYTINNDEPAKNDIAYQKPIIIKNNLTTIKAKVFGDGFIPSETIQATFIKDGLKIKSAEYSLPDSKFSGKGSGTLIDNQGGIADMHNKNFLGYQQDSVQINITLQHAEKIDSVLLDFLQDNGSWIFLPQKISVFYFDKKNNTFELMSEKKFLNNAIIKERSTVFEILQAQKKIIADKLKIIIVPLQSIPPEHPGKGKQGWLFIDEIKIY